MRNRVRVLGVVLAVLVVACGGDVADEFEPVDDGGSSESADVVDDSSADEEEWAIPPALTVPFPDGGKITGTTPGEGFAFVTVQYPVDRYDELVEFYRDWIGTDARDWSESESSSDMQGTIIRAVIFRESRSDIGVTECQTPETNYTDYDGACLTINESN